MALNLDIVGKTVQSEPFTYGPDQVILYALGIGAGLEDIDFIYEKSLKVYPTFAVVPFMPVFFGAFMKEAQINLRAVLHGEHRVVLHQPIPPAATLQTTVICESIYDKGDKGAVINVKAGSRDENGTLLFENRAVVWDRSAGNFGGERGPKADTYDPPENKNPDFHIEQTTSTVQAALYRLSGDKNPLHIDPALSKKLGFERPILHGLCTFAFTGRAVLKTLCGNDPAALKSIAARFMHPVFPGDTLLTEGWRTNAGRYVIRTTNRTGKTVLGNAMVEVNEA